MPTKMVCSICVRGGSTGVPNKNIRLLHGKPLLAHTLEQAKTSGLFEAVVVDTDSEAIAEIALSFGADAVFMRPSALALNDSPKIPAIRHALLSSEHHFGTTFPVHVDLDATSPLRNVEDIVNAFHLFCEKEADILITASPSRKSPYFNMVEVDDKGQVALSKPLKTPVFSRQESPRCYDMNGSIYIWKRDVLLKEDTLFLPKTVLYVMPEERSVDIDTELDFQCVEFLMAHQKNN